MLQSYADGEVQPWCSNTPLTLLTMREVLPLNFINKTKI